MKQKTKQMSVAEYAKIFPISEVECRRETIPEGGVTRQTVLYRITNNKVLPNVEKVEKIGKAYVLTVKI